VVNVGGYGTSPLWGEIYGRKGRKGLYSEGLQFRFDSSGTGPSDHTSFYRKGIPVLFYFTGLHSDYHKPGDDAEKINFHGQLLVVRHILSLVQSVDEEKAKLAFVKTREVQTSTTTRFSVTLGIMPDYTFGGAGVRVDGVSDNRPAQKVGIKTGDVITSIGNFPVTSMEQYMQALSKFKKGDKAEVIYQRGAEKLSATVEF
jgi:C-terminal processing protease CtpA/Prc